jgi:septum formation protein
MRFKTISNENPLVLASASPRRKRILREIGLPFRFLPSRIDEKETGDTQADIACILAQRKAIYACSRSPENWILGADTIVVLQETLLGKPVDQEEAKSMLGMLSGRDHEVITGFSIIDPSGNIAHTGYVSTTVTIKELSEREIRAYIATKEPFGKAGGYAIQGIGAFMVRGIIGSYSNVVGLPVHDVIEALLAVGALDIFPGPM